ncbi:MAG: IS21 family transposase [Granulosicoccus sp.]
MHSLGNIFMIHQLKDEGHSVSEIARRLNMDRKTVRRYLARGLEPPAYTSRPAIGSCLEPFKPYLKQQLESHPGLSATRLLREIKAMGFPGSYTLLTDYLRSIRPAQPKHFEHRFETAPGQQAQVDFARFATRFRSEPEVERIVWLFSMVLGHSRYLYGQFAWRQTLDTVVRCHIAAFNEFGGGPHQCLYDRMRTAVLGEPEPGQVIYHPTLISLGSHYGFMPRACKPYRAKTKGKVERPFVYVRQDFFLGKRFDDINDLNEQFTHWRQTIANARVHGTTQRIVSDAFAEEQSALIGLPVSHFNDVLSMERRITRDGMVSVDGNLYSVPDGTQSRQVQVERTATELRILDGQELLAVHELLLGKHQRQVSNGHRTRARSTPIPHDAAQTTLEREGDNVACRELAIYESIGSVLAQGEIA